MGSLANLEATKPSGEESRVVAAALAPPRSAHARACRTGPKGSRDRRLWPREESNLRAQLRRLPLYPLSYGAREQRSQDYARMRSPFGSNRGSSAISPVIHSPKISISTARPGRASLLGTYAYAIERPTV